MKEKRKPTMTREQAEALYKELQQRMTNKIVAEKKSGKASDDSQEIAALKEAVLKRAAAENSPQSKVTKARVREAVAQDVLSEPMPRYRASSSRGQVAAFSFVVFFAVAKTVMSGLEFAGIGNVEPVEASVVTPPKFAAPSTLGYGPEEVKLLTALDARRMDLDEDEKQLKLKQDQLDTRDREFTVRLTELRDMTEQLKLERTKNSQKKNAQLDQLANVYGSMNPQEAAQLMGQLDITIALSLIERMPEKRIGQILALMNPEKALSLTRMLSEKAR